MNRFQRLQIFAVLSFAVLWPSSLSAEKAPSTSEELKNEAMAIVVGTIDHIRSETEPSEFEIGVGNMDWGIYLTLAIETVEKGPIAEKLIEARCFRIKYRASMSEYLTPSGHTPIPSTGTKVRVYLTKSARGWSVLLPNGIEPLSGKPHDAPEVAALNSRTYTYLLPIEAWFLLAVLIVAFSVVTIILKRVRKRRAIGEQQGLS